MPSFKNKRSGQVHNVESGSASEKRLKGLTNVWEPVSDDDGDSAPAKSASKDEWVDYAVAQGADREAAEASTKAELVDAEDYTAFKADES